MDNHNASPRPLKKIPEELNDLSYLVIRAAMSVHTELGPGLLESAYQACLYHELRSRGLFVEKEVPMPLIFKSVELDRGYRVDLLVNHELVVEIKAKEAIVDVDMAQVLNYLRLGNFQLGLLLNFHNTHLKQGVKRLLNPRWQAT